MLYDRHKGATQTTVTNHLNANNLKVVAGRNSTLQTNILSVIPTTYVILSTHKCVRLGVVVVEIRNPSTNETKSIYAIPDTG